jgi:hypothetical protein
MFVGRAVLDAVLLFHTSAETNLGSPARRHATCLCGRFGICRQASAAATGAFLLLYENRYARWRERRPLFAIGLRGA